MKTILISILSLALLVSCGGESTKDKTTDKSIDNKKEEKQCSYSLLPDAKSSVQWTAYKFTKKAGVGGTFNKVRVVGNKSKSTDVTKVINGTHFTISTASVNSKNEVRDAKIAKSFFGSMAGSETISGKLLNAKGDNLSGTCDALVKLNDIEKEIALKYTIDGDNIELTGTMDMTDWNGLDAVAALNKVCSEKHTGDSGESILWPDVDVKIATKFKVDCP